MKHKLPALVLTAALLAGCFAGCTGSELRAYTQPEETAAAESAAPTEGAAETETVEVTDYTYAQEAYDEDTLVMTINGLEVHWPEYFYWLVSSVQALEQNYGTITDFDAACPVAEDMTYGEYILSYALDAVTQYRAIEYNAAQAGVTLSEEDEAYLESLWESDVSYYGGGDEEVFLEYLDSIYFSRELYDYMNRISSLYTSTFASLYGADGENCPDEEVAAYAEEYGYIQAKHILLLTTTVDESSYTVNEEDYDDTESYEEALAIAEAEYATAVAQAEEANAAALATAEDILAQLQACESQDALLETFDSLMQEYSEDTGLAYYPDGYVFTTGQMDEAFEEAAMALEEYSLSSIVESSYGYHIILRLPLDYDATLEYYSEDEQYSLRYAAAFSLYDSTVANWFEEAEVVYADGFENLDLSTIF